MVMVFECASLTVGVKWLVGDFREPHTFKKRNTNLVWKEHFEEEFYCIGPTTSHQRRERNVDFGRGQCRIDHRHCVGEYGGLGDRRSR